MGFLSNIFGKRSDRDPLRLLNLENESLEHRGITNGVRVWYTLDGDGIGLYYHGIPPDLPREQSTIEAFYAEYRALVQGNIVEIGIEKIANLAVVRNIGKAPQTPTGTTYLGSYIVPFQDFSYVVKIQCEERGTTGIREAILLDKGLKSGEIKVNDSGKIIGKFAADDAAHDDDFPDHPLSRCRRGLRMIASSMTLAEEIVRLPKFELPSH